MIKLELDWASNEAPEVGVWSDEDGVQVIVEHDATPGPSGHPIVRVYATSEREAYRASMALEGWLMQAYGEDEEGAQELLALATDA